MPIYETLRIFLERSVGLKATELIRQILRYELLSFSFVERITPPYLKSWRRQKIFENVYTRRLWGKGGESEVFFSGVGSRGDAAEVYIDRICEELASVVQQVGREITVIDLGCGDFSIGKKIVARLPAVTYVGCDIVADLIKHHTNKYAREGVRFQHVDIVEDVLPRGDVCLIRQVLQHLSNSDIKQLLAKLHQYSIAYISEGQPTTIAGPANPDKPVGSGVRFDCRTGVGRGLELDKPPFDLLTRKILNVRVSDLENILTVEIKNSHRPL